MPRGKKNLTLDEQLEKLNTEIEELENVLSKLKDKKEELETQIKQNKFLELDKIMVEKGITFDKLKQILKVNTNE